MVFCNLASMHVQFHGKSRQWTIPFQRACHLLPLFSSGSGCMAGFFASIAIATGLHISGLRDCQSVNTAAVSRQVFNPSKLLLAGGHFLGNNKTFIHLSEILLAGQPWEAIFVYFLDGMLNRTTILSNTNSRKLKSVFSLLCRFQMVSALRFEAPAAGLPLQSACCSSPDDRRLCYTTWTIGTCQVR